MELGRGAGITIYIDGCCEPINPGGTACWAYEAVDQTGQAVARDYGCIGQGAGMTNNVAEYTAAIKALERCMREGWTDVLIRSDSHLVVKQIAGEWRVRSGSLLALWQKASKLARQVNAGFEWVPRELNGRADYLTRRALKQAKVLRVNNPPRTLRRIMKYQARGVEISDHELLKVFRAWAAWPEARREAALAAAAEEEALAGLPTGENSDFLDEDDWFEGE